MKRFALGALVAAGLSGFALAAVAAPAAPMTWTGFYIGAQGVVTDLNDKGDYDPDYSTPANPYWIMSGLGGGGGVFAGLNSQVSDTFVLGLEGEVNVEKANAMDDTYIEQSQTWDAALKAKFGMPMGPGLLYLALGVAAAHFDPTNYWYSYTGAFNDYGGVIGVGAQIPVADKVFAKIEADYTMYAPVKYDRGGTSPYWIDTPATFQAKAGLGIGF